MNRLSKALFYEGVLAHFFGVCFNAVLTVCLGLF